MISMTRVLGFGIVVALLFCAASLDDLGENMNRDATLKEADGLFDEKNYKDALAIYEKLLTTGKHPSGWRHASKRTITCALRLELFEKALASAEAFVIRAQDTPHEPYSRRLAGNLYLTVPHWGTRAGGVFFRGQYLQGIQLQSHRHDKKLAVNHLERARDLYARLDGDEAALAALDEEERETFHDARIGCLFDLSAALARFGIYENEWTYWSSAWGERDDTTAEFTGEDDFEEKRNRWELQRIRPIGLHLDAGGRPLFPQQPEEYSQEIGDDEKILFLLDEIRRLDRSDDGHHRALSYYRQAMLARTRFGTDRLNHFAGFFYHAGSYPLKEELEAFLPWELADDEALVLAGGKIHKAKLPAWYNVLELLAIVGGDMSSCGIADLALYARGAYYQSRQQYNPALEVYDQLISSFPKSEWCTRAEASKDLINRPQASISPMGVQLSQGLNELQLSSRNAPRIWFVARSIDLQGLLRSLRAKLTKDGEKSSYQWILSHWDRYLTQPISQRAHDSWIHELVASKIGAEVTRWEATIEEDGSHRYVPSTLPTPLRENGAYVVFAFLDDPGEDAREREGVELLELGASRAVMVLTDLAVVEKRTAKGMLYFIADARTGAPLPGAEIDLLELWSRWDRQKRQTLYHKESARLTTGADGTAIHTTHRDRHSRVHAVVSLGDRLAWSGLTYHGTYRPSAEEKGVFAFALTDRPVYRPEQTVRFKAWLRKMDAGVLQNLAHRDVTVEIFDPRGNKAAELEFQTDPYGGFDGTFTLGEEPPLGEYRIRIEGADRQGTQMFRVEEYKKPEFEVVVTPSAEHARLGETITASIEARYYFGSPVSAGSLTYKVFREEYRHSFYFPGPWDWLYGPGYGLSWYSHEWFPWWGSLRSCWAPPRWWAGSGRHQPVRELVLQGEAPIGPDGRVELEIDTAGALRDHPDRDHRYVIQAEVRDVSRRTVSGEGKVLATRQAFYAFVESDRGYYQPGGEMEIEIRCLQPDNRPVEVEGMITLSEVVYGGADNATIDERVIEEWKASTDETGVLTFRLRHERSGQLEITFTAPDAWGGTVTGHALVWICGRDFDGRLYRCNDLELITDKRTYEPGEVCHVMVHTNRAGSHVLFAEQVDSGSLLSWRVLHLPRKHAIVDVPITERQQPNFFIEATTVSDARVHQQVIRACVPPRDVVAEVTVNTPQQEYQPGQSAQVEVLARTPDGKPVRAQVCLSAFDAAVLQIQGETMPDMQSFFHGRLRQHAPWLATSLHQRFSAQGLLLRPFQHFTEPLEWYGFWGSEIHEWGGVELNRTLESPMIVNGLDEGATARSRRAGEPAGEDSLAESELPASSAAPADSAFAAFKGDLARGDDGGGGGGGGEPPLVAPTIRERFADTALWRPDIETDDQGRATVDLVWPENLTTWRINAFAITKATRVGRGTTEAITTKNLLVRLQAPRFFMESDEVVISANVHNELEHDKRTRVSIDLPGSLLRLVQGCPGEVELEIAAGGVARVDWRVRVTGSGTAVVTVEALTDEESDAMVQTFPVLVHGMLQQLAWNGSIRDGDVEGTRTVELNVPERRDPRQTRLEIQYTPCLAGAMLDALPYCLDYPFGCTEQTMSRLLSSLLTLKTLRHMGVDLEQLAEHRGRLQELERIEQGEGRRVSFTRLDNPVFDSPKMHTIISKGLARIGEMQGVDGGWGWWKDSPSSGYMTSYVLYALATARECDVEVDDGMVARGAAFLEGWIAREMQKESWKAHAQHAFAGYVLSLKKTLAGIDPKGGESVPAKLGKRLFDERDRLGLYGKALLALMLADLDDMERSRIVLGNIMQYLETNPRTDVAWFRTPRSGWWYWWNSEIEANAWCLRAIVRLDPQSQVAPRVVRWILENRKNGYYWSSTRDTTLCLAALGDFVTATGEGSPDYTLTIDVDDGTVVKKVAVDRHNFLTCDSRFLLEGSALASGPHTIKISKQGKGALYYAAYLRYFSKEEQIAAAGHRLEVQRRYFRLTQIPYAVEVQDARGNRVTEERLRYERIALNTGDAIASGEIIQVELNLKSDNNYTYLCCEDMKPAGCEPLELTSGYAGQEGFLSYRELRDEKVVFFMENLDLGEHLVRYRLRAETPGRFHALPTAIYGMYVPELRANSDEQIIAVTDE